MSKLIVFICALESLLCGANAFAQDRAELVPAPRPGAAPTRLLFPFATTGSGFDTEITISNTSLDNSGTTPESGTCQFNFYGAGAPPESTSAWVPAGKQLVFTLSQGGSGIPASSSFQGYAIATCGFAHARGTARISEAGRPAFSADAQILTLPRSTAAPQHLLFPFVTNQGGFDTRIQIGNTNADPYGTAASSGSCSLSFYGANAPATVRTGPIAAGSLFTTSTSAVAPGFRGYVVASCDFAGVSGVASMTDAASQNIFSESAEIVTGPRAPAATALLFPSITSRNGADSQLAIANTSADPLGSKRAPGSCSLNFYGTNPPAAVSTGVIEPGMVYTTAASAVAPDFTGYVIAACDFPLSRGWVFTNSRAAALENHSESAEVIATPRAVAPTQLLLTGVTTRDNTDTVIALTNTSQDPFGTAQAAGSCSLSYFGDVDGGRGRAPSPVRTGLIQPGTQLSISLARGDPAQGIPAVPGFRGYVIADCGFPLARAAVRSTVGPMLPKSGKREPRPAAVTPTITVSNAGVGQNLQVPITITFSPPTSASLTLTITSSDGNLVKLGTSAAVGTTQVTTTIPASTETIATFAQAFAASGSVTITASAEGYTSGVGTVTLGKSGFVLSGPNGINGNFTTFQNVGTTLTVFPARLDASGVFVESEQIRGGYSVNVPISSSVTSVGTVATSSVAFSAGMDQQTVPFQAVNTGTTTVSLAAPPTLPSTGYSLTVTVQQNGFIPFTATIGNNLQVQTNVSITGPTLSPVDVTLHSNDASKLKFSTSPTGTPADTITVTIPPNQTSTADFYVQGYGSSGTVGYSATATGYGTLNGTVTLAPSGLVIQSPGGLGSDFNMSLGVGNATISVWTARLGTPVEFQAVAAGGSVSAAVVSSNTGVGTITSSPVTIGGGFNFGSTEFHPVGNGSSTITASATGYTPASVVATVHPPTIVVAGDLTIGQFLQQDATLILPVAAPPAGLDVTLQSGSPLLAISTSPTTAGAGTVTLHVAGGAQFATYYLQSLGSSGTVTYTASATGYSQGTGSLTLAPSSVLILGPTSVTLSGGAKPLSVTTGYLDSNGTPVSQQVLAGGHAPLVVNLHSSSTAVGTVPASATITAGTDTATVNFTPVAGGITTVSADEPSGFATPTSFRTLTITVTSNVASLSITKTHSGSFVQGQSGATYSVTVSNSASAAATSGTVTVTESVPSGMTLVSMAGTGWACPGSSCTRSDVLASGSSYPPITVTVNVAGSASSPLVNQVSVSGGGSPTANASDSTTIGAATAVTVSTNPTGLSIIVDGVTLTAPQTFGWTAGSTHTLNVTSPQGSGGTRYLFGSWSDSGAQSHTVTTPGSAVTYTATFSPQYLLTATASPQAGGSVTATPTGSGGYYAPGTSVQLTAVPASGYGFTGFSGDVTGTINPQTVVMSAPRTVSAAFTAISTAPSIVSVTPSTGTGATQTFNAVYSAANGYRDLQWLQMLFAVATDGGGQSYCLIHYDVNGNGLWLYGDGGFFVGPITPGTASNVLQNSLCAVNTSASSATGTGTNLTLNASVVFKQAGARNVYMRAMTQGQADSGWVQRGTWNLTAAAQSTLSLSPSSGSGTTQTFTLTYPDPPGFAGSSFGWVQFLIAAASDGGGQPFCFVHYDRAGNGLWMYSSDVGFFLGPVTPGTASNKLSSSACSVNTGAATVSNSGGNLVVTLPITMKAPMAGAKKTFQRTLDVLNRDTGWQQTGTWTPQ